MAAQPTSAITFQNFFSATLTADLTTTSTDIFMDNIPNGTEGFLVIDPLSTSSHEVIYYNSKTGAKVVCPSVADGRGQDDTTAVAHLTGTTVIMAPVAAYYETLLALFTTTPQGWTSLAGTFTAPVNNGNRSYTFSTSTDQSTVVSPGMRLKTTRTVAAPTQCTSLNGTTQYYSKTSPAGMTFTDDFVVSAWVKLSSYPAPATNGNIMSRFNGTSGWNLIVNPSGQLQIAGFNASGSNYSLALSYQSLPLNKWVHVAAQLDMSSFTATPTTSYFMIDGVDVPASVSRAGTNPTALVQAGNLEIGTNTGGAAGTFFPGKIAQAAVFNAKVTQATIRTYISQGLAGTETSLISAYSFNNSINDLNTTNANNLTANGSAVATSADSPFGNQANGTISSTLDYAIVTAVTSSTITCQVPEGCTIPTSGGISAVSYSTQKSPYGFPGDKGKWRIVCQYNIQNFATTVSAGVFLNPGTANISVPIGAWNVGFSLSACQVNTVAAITAPYGGLSTSTSVLSDADLGFDIITRASVAAAVTNSVKNDKPVSVSAVTPYYFLIATQVGGGTISLGIEGSRQAGVIYAENSYL